jgi:malonyl-CoA O-methyltransferase
MRDTKNLSLNQIIANRLLQRLAVFRFQPKIILDVGAQNGYTTRALAKCFPTAEIFGVDVSHALLTQSQTGLPWRRPKMIAADYTALPLAKHSVDMIFSVLALPMSANVGQILREFHYLLRPEGLLLFTTLGKDTLVELQHDIVFADMHNIGDQLTQQRFVDPVMDMEYLTLQYSSVARLRQDINSLGITIHTDSTSKLSLTVELIYGHAWGNQNMASTINDRGEVLIPLSAINRG